VLKWIRNYFGFNKSETYGSVFLFLFMGIMLISTPLYEMYLTNSNLPVSQSQLDSVVTKVSAKVEISNDTLFVFDPNLVSIDNLQLLGLQEYLAKRIDKFRLAGGFFYQSSDLYKIYGIDSSWVQKTSSFMVFKTKPVKQVQSDVKPKIEKKISKHDINLADTTQLKSLKGIGTVLSNRIIKFREKLGGFYTMEQLKDVYGLPTELIDNLYQSFFVANDFKPVQIKINTCLKEELASHPYFDWKSADLIINYRKQHFPLKSAEDLLEIPVISPELVKKVTPYLSFEY